MELIQHFFDVTLLQAGKITLLLALTLIALTCRPAWAQPGASVDGVWLGTLQAGGTSLRVQLHVTTDAAGKLSCTLDSLDQRAMGLECANVAFAAPDSSFDVPIVRGHWAGKLSAD